MGEITLGVAVRIRPNRKQKELFHKNFGCVRKVYNETLGKYNKLHKVNNDINPSLSLLNSLMMESKKELFYLVDVESTSLQQSVRDLYNAFSNFFKNPRDFNRPKFHRKKDKKFSFRQTIPANKRIINGKYLSLRKYGQVKIQTSRKYYELLNNPNVKFNNITITYDGINYYAVININTYECDKFELTDNIIGCDINSNCNGWLVTSDGVKEFFDVNHENKMIRHINRLMSKCRKLSRKWKILKKRLQKWYNKRTNKLKDYIERLSYNLVKNYDTIVFEKNYASIKILIGGEQNMIFPLTEFIKKLKYKFQWYKPTAEGVVLVDARNTSKKCHQCDNIVNDLEVKTRIWVCPKCGKTLDRDINAAINILNRWCHGDSLGNTQ